MISQYSAKPGEHYGVQNLMQVVGKRLTMRGFIVNDADMGPKHAKDHADKVGAWIKDGSFKVSSSTTDGIDKAAEGFVGMLNGENFGKAILKIQDEVCNLYPQDRTHS
jgi:NADPH-dependent curcumin reductase CurA